MVPSLTPTTFPSPKIGVSYPPRYANGHISAMGDPIHCMFGSMVGFSGSADRMALFPVTSNPSWRQAAILDNFEWPYLRNGSFAIAQLSCYISALEMLLLTYLLTYLFTPRFLRPKRILIRSVSLPWFESASKLLLFPVSHYDDVKKNFTKCQHEILSNIVYNVCDSWLSRHNFRPTCIQYFL